MKKIYKVLNKKVNKGVATTGTKADAKEMGVVLTDNLLTIDRPKGYSTFDVYYDTTSGVTFDLEEQELTISGYSDVTCVVIASDGIGWNVLYWTGYEFVIEKNCKLVKYIKEVLVEDKFYWCKALHQ